MSGLSELTLIIPTFNRQSYVLRNMRFWSGRAVAVHVLDGSEMAIPTQAMAGITANVSYYHMPISVLDRLRKAVDLVQTEYVALMTDDEFFLPDALETCIRELEADETLVSCMGRCLGFRCIEDRLIGWPAYREMADYSVLQDDPIARMIHHMNPYTCSTIFSVVKTPVWKQAMSITCERQFSVFALGENQFELSVCYRGKSKVIPHLMWLRSAENDGIRAEHDVVRFREWWIDPQKSNDREEFLALMGSALADGDAAQLETVRAGVKAALDGFHEFMEGQRESLRAAVVKRIPAVAKAPIKKILAAVPGANRLLGLEHRSFLEAARDLESTGVHVNWEQLFDVAERIHRFHGLPSLHGMGAASRCGADS